MNKKFFTTVCSAAMLFSLSALDIVKNGVAQLELNFGNSMPEQTAISEFKRIVKTVTGAEFTAVNAPNKLVLGTVKTNPLIAKKAEFLNLDKNVDNDLYVIKTKGNVIYVVGNNPRSAMFGMFELLEQLGCRWFWQGKEGEYLPSASKNLAIGDLDIRSVSAFAYRHFITHPNRAKELFCAHNKMNLMGNSPQYGFTNSWGGHSFNWIFPEDCKTIEEYFKKYPEQFALNNDIRVINQHCYTSKETFNTFVKWIDKFWNTHPNVEYLTLSARDTPIYCKCKECSKFDSSTLFFQFIKKLIKESEKKHPNKKYNTIAYSFYLKVPKIKLDLDNLNMSYCMYNRCYKHKFSVKDCSANQRALAGVEQWRKSGVIPAIYGYHFDIFSGAPVYTPVTPILAEEIRWAKKLGIKFWSTELHANMDSKKTLENNRVFVNRFPIYAITKLLWNPDLDEKALLKDFCKYTFGKGAKEMEQYYTLMQEAWQKNGHVSYYSSNPASQVDNFITKDLIAKVDPLFRAALSKTKNDSRAQRIINGDYKAYQRWRELKLSRDNWQEIAARKMGDRLDYLKRAKPQEVLYHADLSKKLKGFVETCTIAKDSDGTPYIAYKPQRNAKGHLHHDGLFYGNHPRIFGRPCNWINYELSFQFRFPSGQPKSTIFAKLRAGNERFGVDYYSLDVSISRRWINGSYRVRKVNKHVEIGKKRLAKELNDSWHKVEIRAIDNCLVVKIDDQLMFEGVAPLGRGMINLGSIHAVDVKDIFVREIPSPTLAERWHVNVPVVTAAPVLDGKGSSPVWNSGAKFSFTKRGGGEANPPTQATILRTNKALYIKVDCFGKSDKLIANQNSSG